MTSITLDTNVLPNDSLLRRARELGIDIAVVSVSRRETEQTRFEKDVVTIDELLEVAVLGESRLGEAVFGDNCDAECLQQALDLISNRSFPIRRDVLTSGQRRQLRDAMILCAHVRHGREILISDDARAFIKEGRREAIEAAFGTRIMTTSEFELLLAQFESERAAHAKSDNALRGIDTYRLARAMCASLLLIPVSFGGLITIGQFSDAAATDAAANVFYVLFLVSAVCAPVVAIAGLIVGVVAGVRGQLSDEVDRRMWRLVVTVIATFVVLYGLSSQVNLWLRSGVAPPRTECQAGNSQAMGDSSGA